MDKYDLYYSSIRYGKNIDCYEDCTIVLVGNRKSCTERDYYLKSVLY